MHIYILAVITAGLFVITLELNSDHLRGDNVSDPYDLLFSGIGLVVGALVIISIRPQVQGEWPDSESTQPLE